MFSFIRSIQALRCLPFLTCILLTACAALQASHLKPGQDSVAEVERVLGKPAMRWQNRDGSQQLAYPEQGGHRTLMVDIAPDGKLHRIRNVLETNSFALIQAGMSKEEVLRTIGPPDPTLTIHFTRRNELTWGWTFQEIGDPNYFFVILDADKGTVRSTMVAPFRVIVDFF